MRWTHIKEKFIINHDFEESKENVVGKMMKSAAVSALLTADMKSRAPVTLEKSLLFPKTFFSLCPNVAHGLQSTDIWFDYIHLCLIAFFDNGNNLLQSIVGIAKVIPGVGISFIWSFHDA